MSAARRRDAMAPRARGPHRARSAVGRRARQPEARAGATCAGCCALLRPYRARAARDVRARCCSAPPPRSRRRCWPRRRSTSGIEQHDTTALVLVVVAFLVSALLVWAMTYVQTYLVGLGRTARARRPAHPHLHPPADAADRLLREPPGGRADLAHDQRRGGARQPRDRLGRDALPGRPDAARHDRDPARARRRSWRCSRSASSRSSPAARSGSGSPRPARSGARARRSARSPPTCRRPCRASASCAASARSPATRRASPS